MLVLLTAFDAKTPEPAVTPVETASGLDQFLDFSGQMSMRRGDAFILGAETNHVRVIKEWRTYAGNVRCLAEKVRLSELVPLMHDLPPAPHLAAASRGTAHEFRQLALSGVLPPHRDPKGEHPILMASASSGPANGLLLDYALLASQSNLTLAADTTYYVSGLVNASGTTTIEGGAVIKFTNTASAEISFSGPLVCNTDPYRPAVFCSKDFDILGDAIPGSTGTPPTNGLATYLNSNVSGSPSYTNTFRYLRFCDGGTGLAFTDGSQNDIWHCQFVKCAEGINWCGDCVGGTKLIGIHNSLFAHCGVAIWADGFTVRGEHLTVDGGALMPSGVGTFTWPMTNCIFTSVTNLGGGAGFVNCVTNSSSSGFYQSAGGANYYLADESPYRDAGTTNINPAVLADLRGLTTYPPIVVTPTLLATNGNPIIVTNDTNFYPQAQRDTDTPDLGYHYPPLDFEIGFMYFTNCTVTILPGTALGMFGTNSGTYCIGLGANASMSCQGQADSTIHLAEYSAVQESAAPNWRVPVSGFVWGAFSARFADFSIMGQDTSPIYWTIATDSYFQDCSLHGGTLPVGGHSLSLTNCLLDRVAADLEPYLGGGFAVANCLVRRGDFFYDPGVTGVVRDNFFDQSTIEDNSGDYGSYPGGYNAYITNCDRLLPHATGDIVLGTNAAPYATGPFGKYYQLTNSPLVNAGSTTANLVGLYHYTITTNLLSGLEIKETNSVVDIGLHYVATDSSGHPIDTDADGFPDYLEDSNGNGSVDSGETDWQSAVDLGLKVLITRPRSGTVIP